MATQSPGISWKRFAVRRPSFPWYRIVRMMVRHYPRGAGLPQALVSISDQTIYLVRRFHLLASYPISTSRFGTGTIWHSYRTPLGVHCVAQKIGAASSLLTRFKARRRQGKAKLNPLPTISSEDAVCTRILWLDGLENRYNRNGFLDSLRRCIYIHGTIDEKRIGRPSSLGCIRMRNTDVCRVFDLLENNSLVCILQ